MSTGPAALRQALRARRGRKVTAAFLRAWVLLFAGTDMNKYALDGERAALMRSVIARSSAVVALSEPLMTACRAMIGSGP